MATITVDRVTKQFGHFTAVEDMDIRFADAEVTCLLGPSGCGKTTLMRMIAGLERPTSGRILFGDRDVTALPTATRNIGMVFQYPVMYPTLSVAENIALPLKQDRTLSAGERDRRVDEMLDVLDMRGMGKNLIGDLDLGNRQKVAVGRAIARRSAIVLFDEPTTNVEVNAKLQLIRAIKLVIQRTRQTIVYVTHDQTEAMTLADRIALMFGGKIVQYDTPARLYDEPLTEFGGWFLGSPGMNFVGAEVRDGRITAPLAGRPSAGAQGVDDDRQGQSRGPARMDRHAWDGATRLRARDAPRSDRRHCRTLSHKGFGRRRGREGQDRRSTARPDRRHRIPDAGP